MIMAQSFEVTEKIVTVHRTCVSVKARNITVTLVIYV
jgi:hypothetical protein